MAKTPKKLDPARTDYDVGYRKPPKEHQFKKGEKSRNMKGRPPLSRDDFGAVVRRQASKMITFTENGEQMTTAMKELMVIQLLRDTLNGDKGARKIMFDLLDRHDIAPPAPDVESPEVMAEKKALSAKFIGFLDQMAAEKKASGAPRWRPEEVDPKKKPDKGS